MDKIYWENYYNAKNIPEEPSLFARYIKSNYIQDGKSANDLAPIIKSPHPCGVREESFYREVSLGFGGGGSGCLRKAAFSNLNGCFP